MPTQPDRNPSLVGATVALLLLAAAMWRLSRHMAVLEETAHLERNRRRELQDRLDTREDQLDGALGRIKELMPDEPAASGE